MRKYIKERIEARFNGTKKVESMKMHKTEDCGQMVYEIKCVLSEEVYGMKMEYEYNVSYCKETKVFMEYSDHGSNCFE